MKNYIRASASGFKRRNVISRPTRLESLNYEELYDDLSEHISERIRGLQTKQWRKFKRQQLV